LGLALLLVSTNFEVLATLDGLLGDTLANLALELKYNLLCSLGLLVENRLCLTTEATLFAVVTPLPLRVKTILALLVLCDLVQSVLSALLCLAVGLPRLWNVNLSTSGRHISLANAYCYCPLARPSRADPWPLMALYVYYARRLFATHHETRVALAIARFNFKRMDSAPQQQPRGAIRVRYTFRW